MVIIKEFEYSLRKAHSCADLQRDGQDGQLGGEAVTARPPAGQRSNNKVLLWLYYETTIGRHLKNY